MEELNPEEEKVLEKIKTSGDRVLELEAEVRKLSGEDKIIYDKVVESPKGIEVKELAKQLGISLTIAGSRLEELKSKELIGRGILRDKTVVYLPTLPAKKTADEILHGMKKYSPRYKSGPEGSRE